MLTISVAKQAEGVLLRMGIDRIEFRATYATNYQLYCYFTKSIQLGGALSTVHSMERTQRISFQVVFFDKQQRAQENYQITFSTARAAQKFTCGFVSILIGLEQQAESPLVYLQFVKFFNLNGSKVFLEDARKQAFLPEKILQSIPIYGERIKFTISAHKQINYEIIPQVGVFQTRFPNGIGMCFYFADTEQGDTEEFIFSDFDTPNSGFCTKKVPVFVQHDQPALQKNDNAVLTPEPAADAFYCFNGNFVKYDPEIVSRIEELQLKNSSPAVKQLFDDLVYFDDKDQPYTLAKGAEQAAEAGGQDQRVYIQAAESSKASRDRSEQGPYSGSSKSTGDELVDENTAKTEKIAVCKQEYREDNSFLQENGGFNGSPPSEQAVETGTLARTTKTLLGRPSNQDSQCKQEVGCFPDGQQMKPQRQDGPEALSSCSREETLPSKSASAKTAPEEENSKWQASGSCPGQQKEVRTRQSPTKSMAQKHAFLSSSKTESKANVKQSCLKSVSKTPDIPGNRVPPTEQAKDSVHESQGRVPAYILQQNNVIEADGSSVRFLEDQRGEPLIIDGLVAYVVRGKLCRRIAIDGYVCYQELSPQSRMQIDGQRSETLGGESARRIYTDKNGAQYVEAFGQRFLLCYQHKLAQKLQNSAKTIQYQTERGSKAGSAQLCKQNDRRPSDTLLPELKRRTRSQQRTKSDDRHQATEFAGVGHAVQRLQQQFIDCSKQFKMKTFHLGGFAK